MEYNRNKYKVKVKNSKGDAYARRIQKRRENN